MIKSFKFQHSRFRLFHLVVFCMCMSSIAPFQRSSAHKRIIMTLNNQYGANLYLERSSVKNMSSYPGDISLGNSYRYSWGILSDWNTPDKYHQVYYQIYNEDKHGA